ncbi:MAG: ATP-binding protein [Sedimentisphaerales bacterium]|nr:ATP-binding protein [Sedimentisphaerales bacterium]
MQEQTCTKGIEVRICAEPAYLSVVRCAVRQAAKLAGLDEKGVDSVTLAIDEALTNVIRHSYGGPCTKPIIVRICQQQLPEGPAVEFIVRDYGKTVDPAKICSRNLDDVRPGGLGVHIIKSVMDIVEYIPQQDGQGMLLRMAKYLEAATETTASNKNS